MNKSLDLIEHETRYAQIHLRHILEDGVNKWLPKLAEIAGFNWDVLAPALASLMSTAESIPDRLYDLTRWAVSGVDATRENGALLAEIRDLLGARPAAVTIKIIGAASPAATADAVALKLQGVML
jgi:hypothetical protein